MSAKMGFTAGLAVGLLAGSRAGRGLYDRSAAAATSVVNDPRVRRGASSALHKAGSAGSAVAGAAARKVRHHGETDGEASESEGGDGAAGGRGTSKGKGKEKGKAGRRMGMGMKAGKQARQERRGRRDAGGDRQSAEHARAMGRADGFRALREGIAGMKHHSRHGEGMDGHGKGMAGTEEGMAGRGKGTAGTGEGMAGREGMSGSEGMNGYGAGGGAGHAHHAGMSAPSVQARPKEWMDGDARQDGERPGEG